MKLEPRFLREEPDKDDDDDDDDHDEDDLEYRDSLLLMFAMVSVHTNKFYHEGLKEEAVSQELEKANLKLCSRQV